MSARLQGGWAKRSAVQAWQNSRSVPPASGPWSRFRWFALAHHELRRALLGIDQPTAWCGDRNARIRRMILHAATFSAPRLP